jgi:hypothetical protein
LTKSGAFYGLMARSGSNLETLTQRFRRQQQHQLLILKKRLRRLGAAKGDNAFARLKKRASFSTRKFDTSGIRGGKSLCMIPERFAIAMIERDANDDYELNDGAPAWVKQEIESIIAMKQLNSFKESCPSKTQTKRGNTILGINADGENRIMKDTEREKGNG